MQLEMDYSQSAPAAVLTDSDGTVLLTFYACKNGTLISTPQGNFLLPSGKIKAADHSAVVQQLVGNQNVVWKIPCNLDSLL